MHQNQTTDQQTHPATAKQTPATDTLTDHEKNQLADEATQEAYRKAHLAQLRQRQCPGCGEEPLF